MRTFVLIFLAMHLPLFVYPILRLASWLELSVMVTLLVLIPLVSSQVVSRWLLRDAKNFFTRMVRVSADFWLGMSPILVMWLLVSEGLVVTGAVIEKTAAIWVLSLTSGCSFIGLLAAVRPMIRTISFNSERLKTPVRFVQITDVHIGSRSSRFLEHVVARVKALEPDFLCITGDFVDAPGVTEDRISALRNLDCPIYFCTGNHERYEDLEEILKRLRNLGVRVLRTQSEYHRADIQLVGIDDRDDALQVERELAKIDVDQQAFSILLYHRPRGLEAASRAGVDLMLSGHTHNGQIIPFNFVVNRVF